MSAKHELKVGDRVAFSAKVIRACQHAAGVANFVGTVTYIDRWGKTCDVTHAAGVRAVPCANLVRIKLDGVVLDLGG